MRLSWTVLALGLGASMSVSCTGASGGSDSGAQEDGTGDGSEDGDVPVVSDVLITESPANHLAIKVAFSSSVEGSGELEVVDDEGLVWQVSAPAVGDEGRRFEAEVIGLRPLAEYKLYPRVRDGNGDVGGVEVSHIPGPLPEDFPPISASGQVPEGEAGWTFFNVYGWFDPGVGVHLPDPDYGYVVAVDRKGRVVWYRRVLEVSDVRITDDDHVLALGADLYALEYDLYGRELDRWEVGSLSEPLPAMHHALAPRPDGDGFFTLGVELRSIDGYDDGMGGTTAYDVVGDTIVNFDRDGIVVSQWSLLDALDPSDWYRTNILFHAPFWDGFFPDATDGTKDWSHGNALVLDEEREVFLLSARHLSWVVALDSSDGSLRWKLGKDGDFALMSDLDDTPVWFDSQHAPEVQDDGSVLIYDNGNYRDGTGLETGDTPPSSRVVRYALDMDAMEATEVWSWQAEPTRFAPFVGDADTLDSGHVLVTDGGIVADASKEIADLTNHKWAVLSEVDPSTGEVVWEIEVGSASAEESYTVYRAERWSGPY